MRALDGTHLVCMSLSLCLLGCGPSAEDLVRQLSSSQDREAARQELLLAKERAVTPLLAALTEPDLADARYQVVDVLLSLMMRVEDRRIGDRLRRLLVDDPAPEVRARIARGFGMQGRAEGAESLIAALDDAASELKRRIGMAGFL